MTRVRHTARKACSSYPPLRHQLALKRWPGRGGVQSLPNLRRRVKVKDSVDPASSPSPKPSQFPVLKSLVKHLAFQKKKSTMSRRNKATKLKQNSSTTAAEAATVVSGSGFPTDPPLTALPSLPVPEPEPVPVAVDMTMIYNRGKKDWALNKFDCPDLSTHKDRYCSFCGNATKGMWVRCNNELCLQMLTQDLLIPQLPGGWVYWSQCQVIPMEKNQAFCQYCGRAGPRGLVFQDKAERLKRQKFKLLDQFRQDVHALPPNPVEQRPSIIPLIVPVVHHPVEADNEARMLNDKGDFDLANIADL